MRLAFLILLFVFACAARAQTTNLATGDTIATGDELSNVSAAAAAGVSKTDLVAWWDLADTNDAHSTYDLSATGSPAYTAGTPNFVTLDADPDAYLRNNTIDAQWNAAETNVTWVIRFRLLSTMATGDRVFYFHGGRSGIRWFVSAAAQISISGVTVATTTLAKETWYSIVCQFSESSNILQTWINGTEYSTTNSPTFATGDLFIGGAAAGNDLDCDYFGVFSRHLTSDERTALYNAGGTFTYADFD